MTLREQQSLFALQVARLIERIYAQGYEVTLDWAYRPPEVAAYYETLGIGIRSSLHTLKLAQDLNLFRDGVWLRSTEDHKPFGTWWEAQHPLNVWGGRFNDGNHYASTRGGVR